MRFLDGLNGVVVFCELFSEMLDCCGIVAILVVVCEDEWCEARLLVVESCWCSICCH